MKHDFLETMVGAAILLAAAIFFAFGYKFSNHSKTSTINVKAYFDRADGLTVGSEVRTGGIDVGEVSAMTLDPKDFKACVKMKIDASLNLPLDTSAEIVSENLMGGKYVNLTPGGDSESLKNGGKITLTQSSVSLEEMLGKYIFGQLDSSSKNK